MSKKTLFLSIIIMGCLLTACGHEHTWSEATCTEPQKCTECGETQGEPLGHTTDFGKCERCGEVFGKDIFQDIVDTVADAEKDYNNAFNAVMYSGATDVSSFKKYVDANKSGFENYEKKINQAIEKCGDYELLRDYKNALKAATTGIPSSMNGTDDKSFDLYIEKGKDHVMKIANYQMLELPIYEEFGLNPRYISSY